MFRENVQDLEMGKYFLEYKKHNNKTLKKRVFH